MKNGRRFCAELSVRLAATFSRQMYIFHHVVYIHYAFCNVWPQSDSTEERPGKILPFYKKKIKINSA